MFIAVLAIETNTVAQPGGITLRADDGELRDALLADLRAAMPVGAVLLFLDGAIDPFAEETAR